jgi:hypothetical protein
LEVSAERPTPNPAWLLQLNSFNHTKKRHDTERKVTEKVRRKEGIAAPHTAVIGGRGRVVGGFGWAARAWPQERVSELFLCQSKKGMTPKTSLELFFSNIKKGMTLKNQSIIAASHDRRNWEPREGV